MEKDPNPDMRRCYNCKHTWFDADEEYKLCPKCGSPTVIRASKSDTGIKLLALRVKLSEEMKPLFEKVRRNPEFTEQCAHEAAERALSLLIKELCHG